MQICIPRRCGATGAGRPGHLTGDDRVGMLAHANGSVHMLNVLNSGQVRRCGVGASRERRSPTEERVP
jgi:hypothetical protein